MPLDLMLETPPQSCSFGGTMRGFAILLLLSIGSVITAFYDDGDKVHSQPSLASPDRMARGRSCGVLNEIKTDGSGGPCSIARGA